MILVTGATGHIGNVLVRELISRGKQVRALIQPGEDLAPIANLDLEVVEGDVLDAQALYNSFQGIQDVYHLAGVISIMPGNDQLVKLVNILGTRNVLHAARLAGIRRLVYTSSIHAIRRMPHGITIDESIPFDPVNAISSYDYSKAQATLEVLEAVQSGLDAVVACPTGVIGPFDFRKSEIGQIILGCVQNKPQIYIDGAYDFVDVRDVANGLIAAGECGRTGEAYILSGEQITVRRLLESIWSATGIHLPTLRVPLNLARFFAIFTPLYYRLRKIKPRLTKYSLETLTSNSVVSHAKAQYELDYQPRPIRESIADTVRWFMENKQRFLPTAKTS